MKIPKYEIPERLFSLKEAGKVVLISKLVSFGEKIGLGVSQEKQQILYNDFQLKILKDLGNFLIWFYENECPNFRTRFETESLTELLLNARLNDKKILIYALFCPAYKKGENIAGFKREIGNTTKRGIENINNISKKAEECGIKVSVLAVFSDLALENFDKLNKTDFVDMEVNFQECIKYAKKTSEKILFIKLSEIKEARKITTAGILAGKVYLTKKEIDHIVKRSLPFYKNILGWEDKDILCRTEILARSCLVMKQEIEKIDSSAIMVMTENNYERGRFYNPHSEKQTPIFYPLKKEVNIQENMK